MHGLASRFAFGLIVVPFLMAGCSGGTEFVDLNGAVTIDGQPVPYGRIDFVPDADKGNSGGNGFAVITDGRFDTATQTGRGSGGGPHKVRISAYDSKPSGAGNDDTPVEGAQPKPLCIGYELEVDLPTKSGQTQDFNLPAAAKGYNQSEQQSRQRPATDA